MQKVIITLLLLLDNSFAQTPTHCDTTAVNKEYLRCTVYVEQRADKSKQSSCMAFAKSMEEGNNFARASWFYILGGDFTAAIKSGEKALKVKDTYAASYLAEAYLLTQEQQKATHYFTMISNAKTDKRELIKKEFEILTRLYPKKFDQKEALKLFSK